MKRKVKTTQALPVDSPKTLASSIIKMQESRGYGSVVNFLDEAIASMESLGEYVCRKRMSAKLRQSDIAAALGFSSQQYISNLERGVSLVAPKHLKDISRLTKCDYNELVALYFAALIKSEIEKLK